MARSRSERARALHDKHGVIVALTNVPADAPPASIAPGPGQTVSEVELPAELTRLETEEQVIEALRQFRVEAKTEAKLVRKSSD
jgi:hypothetical protein